MDQVVQLGGSPQPIDGHLFFPPFLKGGQGGFWRKSIAAENPPTPLEKGGFEAAQEQIQDFCRGVLGEVAVLVHLARMGDVGMIVLSVLVRVIVIVRLRAVRVFMRVRVHVLVAMDMVMLVCVRLVYMRVLMAMGVIVPMCMAVTVFMASFHFDILR